jgi:hypothetical protein
LRHANDGCDPDDINAVVELNEEMTGQFLIELRHAFRANGGALSTDLARVKSEEPACPDPSVS